MRLLLNWPMVLLLSLQRRLLQIALSAATEQKRDALALVCKSCGQEQA